MSDEQNIEQERRQPLSDTDIEKIAASVAIKTKAAFHIEAEKHYNDHKKLDAMLEAYDNVTNIFWKTFLALIITGALVLAGMTASKGLK